MSDIDRVVADSSPPSPPQQGDILPQPLPQNDTSDVSLSSIAPDQMVEPIAVAATVIPAPATMSIPDAVTSILGKDVALAVSGACRIKTAAMKDEGEAQCVESGACETISNQLGLTDDEPLILELGKAMINTASSAAGFHAHLQAGACVSIVKQLSKPGLSPECIQIMCKAVLVVSFERPEGQTCLVGAGAAPALVSILKLHTDHPTLLRAAQAIASLVLTDDSCKMAFVRADFAAAVVPHLSMASGQDCLLQLIACVARCSTVTEGKHELLKSNIAPAIITLLESCEENLCALVACTAARLAILDEGDDALSKAGIAAAIVNRFEKGCKSQDLLMELSKAIGNIASNSQYNTEYCSLAITLPLARAISFLDVAPNVARQVLRAMSAIASIDGKPSPEGQIALLQADVPALLTKMLHVCTDNSVVIEIVRAMRLSCADCTDAREQMQAVGAMTALFHQLERQEDIKIAAEIYSSAKVILAGGQPLALVPAPVDHRTLLQKLLCYPNRVKVETPPDDRKWNIEAGLPHINPRMVAIQEAAAKAKDAWAHPTACKPDEMFAKWEGLRDTGVGVLAKSSAKVKFFGLLMSKRMRECVIYLSLAVLVTLYAILLLDSDSAYFLKRAIQTQFDAPFPCTNVSNYAKTFYDIQDADEIFMWLQGVVLPYIYSGSSNHRPQCMCQSQEFVTCSGPHAATNSDISASKTVYSFNKTSNQYFSKSVPVNKRGLPFLAEAVCTDEGAAGNAAISYTVSRVATFGGATRFFTPDKHFLRSGDPFRWIVPNASRIPSQITSHLSRKLYVRNTDGSNSTGLGFWFEVSLSPRCLAPPCAATEYATTAVNHNVPAAGLKLDIMGDAPALALDLHRPCLPETPCMSECGKRECPCNEAHGFTNISSLNLLPSATAGPIGGNNILLLPPRLRNSVVKQRAQCTFPKSLLLGYSDGTCWPDFSSENVQKSGDIFVNAYTAAFGQPDAKALKWLTYSEPVGSTFLPSNTDLLQFYGSGGFLLDIPLDDFEAARRMLHQAKTIGWWNRNSTRALSLELALYNPNVNRFITVQFLLESPYSSGIVKGVQWRHSTLTPWLRPYNFAGLIIQYIIFGINPFILWHLRSTYVSLGSEKFFEDGFMVINVVIAVLLLVATILSMYVLVETARVLVLNPSTMDHHVIYELLYWNGQVSNIFTVVAWLVWIRAVEFLDIFSPKTKILQKVITRSAGDIAIFSSVFVVYLMGFGISRLVAMGSMHAGFRTLNAAMNTQLIEIFVSYDYEAFRNANPVMGPLYFVAFTLVIILLMVNMLAAIVERFVGICKEESENTQNTEHQDIADFSRRLLKLKIQQILSKTPDTVSDNWLEMWAKEGALFQSAGIMSVQELISAADLNSDVRMSMEEFLDFVKKNAEANEEAMYQADSQDEADYLLSKVTARYDEIEAEQQRLTLLLRSKV